MIRKNRKGQEKDRTMTENYVKNIGKRHRKRIRRGKENDKKQVGQGHEKDRKRIGQV